MAPLRESSLPQLDVAEAAVEALRRRLRRIRAGQCVIHVPSLQGRFRAIRGQPFHMHPELFLQVSGATDFQFPQERLRLLPEAACLVPRGVPHGERAIRYRGPFFNVVVQTDGRSISVHTAHRDAEGTPQALNAIRLASDLSGRLLQYLDDIVEFLHRDGRGWRCVAQGAMQSATALLLEVLLEPPPAVRGEPHKVALCRQMIADRLADSSLSVHRLAQQIRCSKDYLSWLFHQHTGSRLIEYINDRRIAHARQLLDQTALNISETAFACGYADPAYFSRMFRRIVGLTPKAYRHRPERERGA